MCGVPGDNALHKLMTTLDRWRNEHNSTSVLPTTQLAKIKPTYHSAYFSGTKRYLFQESSLPKQMRTPTTQQTNIKSNWVGFRHSEKNTFEANIHICGDSVRKKEGKLEKQITNLYCMKGSCQKKYWQMHAVQPQGEPVWWHMEKQNSKTTSNVQRISPCSSRSWKLCCMFLAQ
jgi:hypothetical protein